MIRIEALGDPRVAGPDGEVRVGRKELVLLVYLARHSPRTVPRAELATLLWGEREDAQARHSLRQALVRLKQAVPLGLEVQTDGVSLLPGAWELDAAAFEANLAAGRLREAVARWRGDFLFRAEDAGGESYRTWVEVEREALRRRAAQAFESLAAEVERAADWRTAVQWAERGAAISPLEEGPSRRLIELLRLAGRLDEALDRHGALVARLRKEMDTEPSAEFLRLGAELAQAQAPRRAERRPGSRGPVFRRAGTHGDSVREQQQDGGGDAAPDPRVAWIHTERGSRTGGEVRTDDGHCLLGRRHRLGTDLDAGRPQAGWCGRRWLERYRGTGHQLRDGDATDH